MQESLHLIGQQIWLNAAHNHKHKEQVIFFLCIWRSLVRQNIFQASSAVEEFFRCVRFVLWFLCSQVFFPICSNEGKKIAHSLHSIWQPSQLSHVSRSHCEGMLFRPSAHATTLAVGHQNMEECLGLPLSSTYNSHFKYGHKSPRHSSAFSNKSF